MNENPHGISEIPCPTPAPEPADVSEAPLRSIALSRSKRPWLIFFAIVIVLATTAGITAWFVVSPDPNVTLESFQQIKLGMSVSDVNGIFGMRGKMGPCGEGECPWVWEQGDNYAAVSFGQLGQREGKVTCGHFITPDGKQHWLPRKK